MTIRAILQARLNSSRLPAKMLLPVGDMPLIRLCAERAANKGHGVLVAISDEQTDDLLATELERCGIKYTRGPLNDVLSRFLLASMDMDDTDTIVRLTGDNPVVDGDFINRLIEFHSSHEHFYTRTLSPQDGLPYGLSAEVFNLGELRKLGQRQDLTPADREHVTAYWTRHNQFRLYKSPIDKDLSHLRVTIDTFDDYTAIAKLFNHVKKPAVVVAWNELIDHLSQDTTEPEPQLQKLALGTVQLGLPYGIANSTGQPGQDQANQILQLAVNSGITVFDTAAAYGTSETVIGKFLSNQTIPDIYLQTKIPPLDHLDMDCDTAQIKDAITLTLYRSLYRLQVRSIACLMFHRWADCKKADGYALKVLREFQSAGMISKIGVSVSSPQEALEVLNKKEIQRIQIPVNIFDYRWKDSGFLEQLEKRPDIHVQARSSLLQGVFTLPAHKWPILDKSEAETSVEFLKSSLGAYNRESVADLCYAYLRGLDWIDSIVVGAETPEQLQENVRLFKKPALDANAINSIVCPQLDIRFLDPANWPKG